MGKRAKQKAQCSKQASSRLSGIHLRITAFGVVMLVFGLLLWSRLILVTGHPRTATADPEQQQTQRAQREHPSSYIDPEVYSRPEVAHIQD